MKLLITHLILASLALGADIKSLPNQAGNGNIDLAGHCVHRFQGHPASSRTHPRPGYIVVRIKVEPRMLQAIRISADDFTLVSRKDGERSDALLPSQIGGPGEP